MTIPLTFNPSMFPQALCYQQPQWPLQPLSPFSFSMGRGWQEQSHSDSWLSSQLAQP